MESKNAALEGQVISTIFQTIPSSNVPDLVYHSFTHPPISFSAPFYLRDCWIPYRIAYYTAIYAARSRTAITYTRRTAQQQGLVRKYPRHLYVAAHDWVLRDVARGRFSARGRLCLCLRDGLGRVWWSSVSYVLIGEIWERGRKRGLADL